MLHGKNLVILGSLGLLFIAGCQSRTPNQGGAGTPEGEVHTATATIQAKPGTNTAGSVVFTQQGRMVKVVAEVSGMSPGPHGIHIHENGECDPPDFTSAGEHFN